MFMEIVKRSIREYFAPLRTWWFWLIVLPLSLAITAYFDFYSPAAKRCQETGGYYSVFNHGEWPLQSGCKK